MIGPEPGAASGGRLPLIGRLRELVRDLYREEWALWNTHYKRYFKIAARVLALGFMIGFAYFALQPAQEQKAFALLIKSLRDIPLGGPPLGLALTIFYHNAAASLLAVAAGGLPFVCLPVLDPLVNGGALGLLASISKHKGLNVPVLFLKGVAPHGIVEIPAVLYATSAGIYLSVTLGKRALARRRKRRKDRETGDSVPPPGTETPNFLANYPEKAALDSPSPAGDVVRSFCIVVLPLLFVAAFIEAFVTPLLL